MTTEPIEAPDEITQRTGLPPSERVLRARLAAHAKHAKHDPVAGTKKARAAFLDKFERDVDPDGILEPEERARRAAQARKAHFSAMALRSATVRRQKAARRRSGDPTAARKSTPTPASAPAKPDLGTTRNDLVMAMQTALGLLDFALLPNGGDWTHVALAAKAIRDAIDDPPST